jgi:hypothetical protein
MNDHRYFCHYHITQLYVSQISQTSEKNTDDNEIIVFEIVPSVALSILSGETNSSDWVAIQTMEENAIGNWKLISNKETELAKNDTSLFYKIPEGDFKSITDVQIILDKKGQTLTFYFLIENSLDTTPVKNIEFFITKENDPSFLLNSIVIDLTELKDLALTIKDPDIRHVRKIFKLDNFPNISIFTTKLFPIITMETIEQ